MPMKKIPHVSHIGILPLELKDGKPQDWVWMDEQRVDITSKADKGGPQPEAPRMG